MVCVWLIMCVTVYRDNGEMRRDNLKIMGSWVGG